MENGPDRGIYEFGPFRLDGPSRSLYRADEIVPLPPKVVETLLVLVECTGTVVTKETLLGRVWPDTFVDENNLAQNISMLRRVLKDQGLGIETVPKRGYRFLVPEHAPEPEAILVPAASPVVRGRRRWFILGLVALVAVAVVYLWMKPAAIQAVAVLPFENITGASQDEYLVDGLTELLRDNLAKIGSLRVISRVSSARFKNSGKKLPEIARELKVDSVLEGSVMHSGERIRVSARLVRAVPEEPIWSAVYERSIQDVSELQADIALAIAHDASLRITSDEKSRVARQRPKNREAFEEYLRGRHAWNKRSPAEIHNAVSHFRKAIDLDAAYAAPYAGLADAYNQLGTHLIGERPARETRPLAIAAASKALEIDPELAEAHAALGYARMYDWDWPGAAKALQRAVELNPSYSPARLWLAAYLQQNGKHHEAIAQAHNALQLDPLSPIVRTQVGWTYAHAGDFQSALPYLQEVVREEPTNLWGQWQLGQAYMYTGKHTEAIQVLERAADGYQRNPALLGTLGAAYAMAGRKRDAEALIEELRDLSTHRYVSAHAFTWIYLALGDKDRAFASMEKEFADRSNCVAWHTVWHLLDGSRSDPRYLDLMRRIGLAQAGAPHTDSGQN